MTAADKFIFSRLASCLIVKANDLFRFDCVTIRTVLAFLVVSISVHAILLSALADQPRRPSTGLTKLKLESLPNAIEVDEAVLVGGTPDGAEAFALLAKRGCETVVSVDHSIPQVSLAKQHGLRYVHLPIGYSGPSPEQIRTLAALIQQSDQKVYIHCHHGRHRAPAAAAAGCITAGRLTTEQGKTLLQLAGTSRQYRGLFAAVENATVVSKEELLTKPLELPEQASVPDTAARMVEIDRLYESLRSSKRTTASREHVLLLLEEQFNELLRVDPRAEKSKRDRPSGYRAELSQARDVVAGLRKSTDAAQPEHWESTLQALKRSCKSCHQKHRDNL